MKRLNSSYAIFKGFYLKKKTNRQRKAEKNTDKLRQIKREAYEK